MNTKIKNIIHVVSYYPPHLGGMENCVAEISERLSEKKYRVLVYTSDIGYVERFKNFPSLNVNYLKSIEVAHTPIIFSLFFRLLFIPRESLIHLHISLAYVPEVTYLVSKIRKTPYVAHIHLDVDPSGIFGFLLKPYKKYILVHVLRNASRIICLTEAQRELMINKYKLLPNKVLVIPNGVGDDFSISKRKKINKISRLLFVGRIDSQKNIPLLINALSLIKHNSTLDIVGDGEKRKEIEELIKEKKLKNVTLHGRKTGRELIDFYKRADIFVIPSKKEGLSLSMLEAMAAGLPIVGADVEGIRELIYDCGILVKNPNPQNFSKEIDKLLSNSKKVLELSKKSSNKAKLYSWDLIVNEIKKVYEEVLSETK